MIHEPTHSDDRSYAQTGQARVEIRGLDQPLSDLAAFASTGITSAFLRCVRFGDQKLVQALPVFEDPLRAMQRSNTIPDLHNKHPLRGVHPKYQYASVVQMLDIYLDFMQTVNQQIGLTEEEQLAINLAQKLVTDLYEVHDMDSAVPLATQLDWAARGTELSQTVSGDVNRHNANAVAFDLWWDRTYPEDNPKQQSGQQYWNQVNTGEIVPEWMVEHCVTTPPPKSRAEQLVKVFTELQRRGYGTQVYWDKVIYYFMSNGSPRVRTVLLSDPTGQTPPKDMPRHNVNPEGTAPPLIP